MNVAWGIGIVLAVTQFVKAKIWKVEGPWAVALAALATLAVAAYKGLAGGWSLDLIVWAIEVFVGANVGYDAVKGYLPGKVV